MRILGGSTLLTVALTGSLVAGPVVVPAPASADAAYATIEGSGAVDAAPVLHQWTADVDPSGINAIYAASGSSAGRRDFEQSSTDYAVLDRPQDVTGRDHAVVPLVASGLAITYRLTVHGRRLTDLHLSSAAVLGLVTGRITRWDDDLIAADNPGLDLPATAVTPVVRSDGSATTRVLTSWLDHEQTRGWRAFSGGEQPDDVFPSSDAVVRAAGIDAVARRVQATEGAVGYVPSFFAYESRLPAAKVLNHGGSYVGPGQYAVALALREARLGADGSADLTPVFDAPDRRAYPLSSFASAVIPTSPTDQRMTTAKRQSLVDFLHYSSCTGQQKAGLFGYAPLPLPLVRAGLDAMAELGTADPRVETTERDVRHCANPTFAGADPDRDVLAERAPYPPTCDRLGATVCVSSASPVAVRLAAPLRDGVHVARPGRGYLLTVQTTSTRRPRYYPPVAPGRRLRPGPLLVASGERDGVRSWRLWVRPAPADTRTWRAAVKVGTRVTEIAVRRQR